MMVSYLAPPTPKKNSFSYRKGFFFTILALILVSFMFISIQLWAQGQQANEQRQAERFRLEALRSSLALINNQSLSAFANASMLYAVNDLSNALQDNPDGNVLPCATDSTDSSCSLHGAGRLYPDGTYYVNTSMAELMVNGTTSGHIIHSGGAYTFYQDGSNLTYNATEQKYALSNYFNQTSAAAAVLGYNLTYGKVDNFTFNQTDTWTIQVTFQVPVNLTDQDGLVNVSEDLGANVSMDINGLTDPMVLHDDYSYRTGLSISQRPHRNVYHVPQYNTSGDASASMLVSPDPSLRSDQIHTTEGLGWFFGPVTNHAASQFNISYPIYNLSHIGEWIYETGNQSEAMAASAAGFGAIILDSASDPTNFGNYFQNGSAFINGNNYTIYHQNYPCFYCVLHYQNLSATPPDYYSVDSNSVPAIPDLPYIAIAGPGGSLPSTSHSNYHLGVDEVLIYSHNTSSQIFGPTLPFTFPNEPTTAAPVNYLAKSSSINHDNGTIWDLTGPRDMAICGFYVASPWGPSYTQRFVGLPPITPNTPPIPYSSVSGAGSNQAGEGIESFVVGRWAGGADDPNANPGDPNGNEFRSRVDYLFYQGAPVYGGQPCLGSSDMGLPACKDVQMCTNNDATGSPRSEATGRFALTTPVLPPHALDPTDRYGLDTLVLNVTPAIGYQTWCS